MQIRVATINILRDQGRWPARRALLARGLAECQPDLIALQEVVRPLGASTAHELACDLGGYTVAAVPKIGWWNRGEGIAVLSRWPIVAHQVFALGGEGRVGQIVDVAVGSTRFLLGNAHLLVRPWADRTRTRQVERMVAHLLAKARQVEAAISRYQTVVSPIPHVLCGDFNDDPDSAALVAARRHLVSAYAAVHGHEPAFTCPTALRSGNRLRDAAVDLALRMAGTRATGPWRATLDYILVDPILQVRDCRVILDQPDPLDPMIYPSEHVGLLATLEWGDFSHNGTSQPPPT